MTQENLPEEGNEGRREQISDDPLTPLTEHRFFAGMKPEVIEEIAQCAQLKTFKAGEMLAKEGTSSDYFFAILEGRVAIETYQPGYDPYTLQILHGGDVIGWSWLFPPYEWVFDIRALTLVRTVTFDAISLRQKCLENIPLGFELMRRLAQVMTLRLKAARLQLFEVQGRRSGEKGEIGLT